MKYWPLVLVFSLTFFLPEPCRAWWKPSRCEKDWVLSAAAVIAVGGGAIAGYAAGGHQNFIEKNKVLAKFSFPLSNEVRPLAWIFPPFDLDGPLIRAEIFRPDGTLYFAETLGQDLAPPDPPPIGSTGPAQVGQYRAVFTVVSEGNGPSSLGGIIFDGFEYHTPIFNQDPIPKGAQEIVVLDYPSGLLVETTEGGES